MRAPRSAAARRLGAPLLALVLVCGFAAPAAAQDDFDESNWDTVAEDDEWLEDTGEGYFARMGRKFLIGLNGIVTFPADPVMGYAEPLEEFDEWDELPLGGLISKRMLGFLQGTLLGVYRVGMGTMDVLFSPITPMTMVSPEPRYNLFGVQHDVY
jgi:hypothetical protein